MSKNHITGDMLISKVGNKAAFDAGYDRCESGEQGWN